jgi:hypothetical protein
MLVSCRRAGAASIVVWQMKESACAHELWLLVLCAAVDKQLNATV